MAIRVDCFAKKNYKVRRWIMLLLFLTLTHFVSVHLIKICVHLLAECNRFKELTVTVIYPIGYFDWFIWLMLRSKNYMWVRVFPMPQENKCYKASKMPSGKSDYLMLLLLYNYLNHCLCLLLWRHTHWALIDHYAVVKYWRSRVKVLLLFTHFVYAII